MFKVKEYCCDGEERRECRMDGRLRVCVCVVIVKGSQNIILLVPILPRLSVLCIHL